MNGVEGIDYLLLKHTELGRAGFRGAEGPWLEEPDKAHWIDPVTDLDCLIVRNHYGALCGYVGLPPEHPLHGKGYDDADVSAHGGLTFASLCAEGMEDGICHVPAPGRPHNVWWLGFDCAHAWDLIPGMLKFNEEFHAEHPEFDSLINTDVYRNFLYVTEECRQLALQLKAIA